jgi:hypothetical protein
MKRIADHTRVLENDADLVDRLLREWQPRAFTLSEKEHELDLLAWLRKNLTDVPIIAQYGIAKGKADIVIEDSHVIELKLRFSDADVAEFDRCVGQLERYRQKWVNKARGPVYLVIVGESDTEFRDLLHTWFEEANARYFTQSPFHLVEKRPAA